MKKTSVPSHLATPHSLSKAAVEEIAQSLNQLVANAFALYVKTKNFHWHLFGSHFRDYHLLFDEQAAQIFESIDVIAERVRKLGGLTIHSIAEISNLKTIEDDNEISVTESQMIKRLLHDNQLVAADLRKAHEVCEKHRDFATTSLLEVFLDETERRIWFLFSTQSASGSND